MSEINWNRVFAISFLFLSLLLVCGSIYLHVQQKHHLGRLRHDKSVKKSTDSPLNAYDGGSDGDNINTTHKTVDGAGNDYNDNDDDADDDDVDDDDVDDNDDDDIVTEIPAASYTALDDVSALSMHLKFKSNDNFETVSDECMRCICETVNKCQKVVYISQAYWIDAGQPKSNVINTDRGPYSDCAEDEKCVARAIKAFIKLHAKDCNNDGVVDCSDHISLHIQGPTGCLQSPLDKVFTDRMLNCLPQHNK